MATTISEEEAKVLVEWLPVFTELANHLSVQDKGVLAGLYERLDERPVVAVIEDLTLTPRAYNLLKREGINTVRQLMDTDPQRLRGLRNMDKKCMEQYQVALAKFAYEFTWDEPLTHEEILARDKTILINDSIPLSEYVALFDEHKGDPDSASFEARVAAGDPTERLAHAMYELIEEIRRLTKES